MRSLVVLAPPIPVLGNELLKKLGRKRAGRDGNERRKLEALSA